MAFTPTGVEFVGKGFNKYLTQLGKADKAQQGLGKSASGISTSFSSLGRNVLGFGANLAKVAAGGVAALGIGLVAAGGIAVNTAISFESAFAGVEKTVDGLDKVIDGLGTTLGEKLKGGLVEISKVAPTTFEDLAAIGELGGQLGIQFTESDDSLLKFTETIAALGVSTSLSEEQAATSLARISNIFQRTGDEAGENIERLGSTIVALGNNFATTEPEIVNFATRIAGAGAIAGLTQADILGIGTAFSSVGVQAEAGGTAVQKVLLAMNGAVNATSDGFIDNSKQIDANVKRLTKLQAESARLEAQAPGLQAEIVAQGKAFVAAGGSAEDFGRQLGDKTRQKAFETATAIQELSAETQLLRDQQGQPIDPGQLSKFAQVAGVSADEFAEAWEKDAAGAFQLFVEGLGREGDNAESVLRDLNLTDQRLIRSFLSLAGAGDLLNDTLELGSQAWEDNTALAIEAEKRYATTESQIQILKNTFRAIADSIGSRFLPILNQLITTAKDLVEKWADPIQDVIENTVLPAIDKVTGAFERFGLRGGTVSILGLLGLGPDQIAGVLGVVDQVIAAIDKVSGAFERFGVRGAAVSILGLLGLEPGEIATVLGTIDIITVAITDFVSGVATFLGSLSFDEIIGGLVGIGAVVAGGVLVALVAGLFALLTPINLIIAAAALLGAAWAGNWGNIQGITMSAIATLTNLFNTAFPIIQAIVMTTGAVISSIFAGIMSVIMGQVVPNLQAAFQNITVAINSLGLNWSDIFNAILTATGIVAAAIGAILLALVATITGVISGLSSVILTFSQAIQNMAVFVEQIITGIIQFVLGFQQLWTSIFAGDLPGALEGFKLAMSGIGNFIGGIFGAIFTAVTTPLVAIITFLGTFVTSVIEFFTTLSDTLVGNSIIPDMVMAIIDIFTSMIEPILSVFSTLSEGIASVLGAIFGGGEEEAPSFAFDPAEAVAGLEEINALTEQLNSAIVNIFTTTLPTLTTTVLATVAQIIPQWMSVIQTITQLNMLLVEMYTVHLPTLQQVSDTTTQAMVTGFTQVNAIVTQTISLIVQLTAEIKRLGAETKKVTNQMIKAFKEVGEAVKKLADNVKSAAQSIKTDLVQALNGATEAANRLRNALQGATMAAGGLGGALEAQAGIGIGAAAGIGFQAGTLGFTVPQGFPNDSFPIRVQSGEEVLVAPANSSIDEIVMDTFGVGGQSVVVEVNVGEINTPMNLAIVTEQIKRVVAGEVS